MSLLCKDSSLSDTLVPLYGDDGKIERDLDKHPPHRSHLSRLRGADVSIRSRFYSSRVRLPVPKFPNPRSAI
jgi:hypothetical protein